MQLQVLAQLELYRLASMPFDDRLFDVLNVRSITHFHLQWWISDDAAFLEVRPQEICYSEILSHEQHLKPGLQVIDLF